MSIDHLKTLPGHLLRRVHQISSAIFSEEMAAYELTSVQFMALVAIADLPEMDATRLSELVDFDKATIGGVIERLERKGLIERQRSAEDKRIKILAATPAGRALIKVSMNKVERVQKRLLAPLPAREQKQLMQLLEKLIAAHHPDADSAP